MKRIHFHRLGDTFDLIILIPCIIGMVFYWVGFLTAKESELYSISMVFTHSLLVVFFLRQLVIPNSIIWTKTTIDFRLGKLWARRVAINDVKEYSIDREKLLIKLPFQKSLEMVLSRYDEQDVFKLREFLSEKIPKPAAGFSEN